VLLILLCFGKIFVYLSRIIIGIFFVDTQTITSNLHVIGLVSKQYHRIKFCGKFGERRLKPRSKLSKKKIVIKEDTLSTVWVHVLSMNSLISELLHIRCRYYIETGKLSSSESRLKLVVLVNLFCKLKFSMDF